MARRVRLAPTAAELAAGFAAIRAELGLPAAFPPDAVPAAPRAAYADATGVAFVTIDPPGSRDLDQAFHAARRGDGYRVTYAIADPGAFLTPGLDAESRRRGKTLYCPDARVPLYPPALSEGAASLLAGEERPAVVWTLDLDAAAEPVAVRVERARVRSRAQLDYPGVQRALDTGTADEPLVLLRELGRLRQEREAERGAVSLRTPAQEVVRTPAGYGLAFVAPLPVEDWNAQVSLLTGMCAARVMLGGGVGLLRTLPPPDLGAVAALRRAARVLEVDWPEGEAYAGFIRRLDPAAPPCAALLALATTLLRGAGYTAFDGAPPEQPLHSAIAAPYAHATAPLRRLADRFVSETCLALHAGREVPGWCRDALPGLPALMAAADRRERELERAVLDYVEAAVLAGRVGETFDAVVTDADERGAMVQLAQPAVRARLSGDAPLGERIRVRLAEADPARRRVRFAVA
ncbi:MAG TPA: RNB domain-containing ribonuclease [Mycobacteriales bacterium]|jgi:exoribonuclease R|nr:RNB domain-containing ribonuclease [Mycobacteriales bacterium]